MPNCISRTAFRGFLRGWEATACHGAQRRGRSYCSRVRRAGDGVRRAAELSRREFCYHRAGRTRVFSWGCVTCRGRGPVPLFGAAVLGQRGRGGPDLCPWSYRGGGGRGQRSPVRAGKVRPTAAAGILAGLRAKGRTGRPVLGRISRPLALRPRAVGGSGQEEEAAMVNAGAAAYATGKDRPRALPLLFNLCCCQPVTPYPSISHTKIINVIAV